MGGVAGALATRNPVRVGVLRPWMRRLGALPLFLVCTLPLLLWVPLFRTAGYEFFVAWAVLLSVGLPLRVAARVRSSGRLTGQRPGLDVADALRFTVPLGLTAIAVGFALEPCDPWHGVSWWAAMVVAALPWWIAVGHVLALLARVRTRLCVLAGLHGVAAFAAISFFLFHPPLVSWSSFVGFIAGSLYDEALGGTRDVWVFRAWTTLLAVTVLVTLRTFRAPTPGRAWLWVLLGVSVFAGDAWMRTHGPVYERGRIAEELGGYVQTEHFRIFYDARAFQGAEREAMIADHERRYRQMATFWGTEPSGRVDSWVYGSPDRRGELTGARSTLFARIWLGEMHTFWRGPGDEALAHELAHLFLREDGRGPLRLAPGRWGLPSMGLVEGAATAAAWGSEGLTYHGWSAAVHALDMAPDLAHHFGPTGFWSQPSGLAYTLMGSFVRWLIDERGGAQRFRNLYASGEDFDGVYGAPVEVLLEAWKQWLAENALDATSLEEARVRYDRPSIFGRRCARASADTLVAMDRHARRGDVEAAADAARRLRRLDPSDLARQLDAAERLWRLGLSELAEELVSPIADQEGAGVVRRRRAQLLRVDIAWSEDRLDDAHAYLRAAGQGPMSLEDPWRLTWRQHALHAETPPEVAALLRRWLAERPARPWSTLALEMAAWATHHDDPVLRALVSGWWWRHGVELPWSIEIRDCVDLVSTPAPCRELLHRARAARQQGASDACAMWAHLRDQHGPWMAVHAEAVEAWADCMLDNE